MSGQLKKITNHLTFSRDHQKKTTHKRFVCWSLSESPDLIYCACPDSAPTGGLRWRNSSRSRSPCTETALKRPRSSCVVTKKKVLCSNIFQNQNKTVRVENDWKVDARAAFHVRSTSQNRRKENRRVMWCNRRKHDTLHHSLDHIRSLCRTRSDAKSFTSPVDIKDRFPARNKRQNFLFAWKKAPKLSFLSRLQVDLATNRMITVTSVEVRCDFDHRTMWNCASLILVPFILTQKSNVAMQMKSFLFFCLIAVLKANAEGFEDLKFSVM